VSVDRQLVVRGAQTDTRLAESRSRTATIAEAALTPTSSNVLRSRHNMSDFEDLGLDDGELLTTIQLLATHMLLFSMTTVCM